MITLMGDVMQIYLSKPGSQREGPYTLEQINQDLAAQKYRDTDYWAWHEGLSEWVPLYNLPGIAANGAAVLPAPPAAPPAAVKPATAPPRAQAPSPTRPPAAAATTPAATVRTPAPAPVPIELQILASDSAPAPTATAPAATAPKPEEGPAPIHPQLSAGMPFAALDHIFLFTTGDGPAASQSPEVGRILEAIVGTDGDIIRPNVSRDVIGRCAVGELLKPDGSISEAVWSVMAAHQPDLVKRARERLYRVCVRTFRAEADSVVALVLFYNKEKL
jgi:hypothetical protein